MLRKIIFGDSPLRLISCATNPIQEGHRDIQDDYIGLQVCDLLYGRRAIANGSNHVEIGL
jgi:hypothetical protein